MHVVYYFEPWVELGRPFLRYHNYRYQMAPQIAQLVKCGHKVSVVMGEATHQKCVADNFEIQGVDVAVIKERQLRNIFPDYLSASVSLANGTASQEQNDAYFAIVEELLHGKKPDVFISFLSPVPFIEKAWKETLVLYTEFGLFSRVPFPRSFYFDAFGMFKDSYIRRFEKELKSLSLSPEQKSNLDYIRNSILKKGIQENNPVKSSIIGARFSKKLLLPLQFSGYFGFDAYSKYRTQYEFLCDVMETIDPEIGVVVTEHTGWEPVVTDQNVDYLIKKYPNLIIPYEYRNVNHSSQFLLSEVDGVVSVSSSVGLQSVLWGKPLFAMGDTHLNTFKAGDISDAKRIISEYSSESNDAILAHLLERYYQIEQYAYDGEYFASFLQRSVERHREGTKGFDFYDKIDETGLYANLASSIRVEEFKKQIDRDMSVAPTKLVSDKLTPLQSQNVELFKKFTHISFDVFDTLIQRPFMMPHQMFLMMQDKVREIVGDSAFEFHKARRYYEHKLRTNTDVEEVTIREIYDFMCAEEGFSADISEKLVDLEIQTEFRYCETRPAGKELYDLAQSLGKNIVIVSDFHLNTETVANLLEASGYKNWSNIYVSSDIRKTKKHGSIFPYVLNDLSISARDMLHIGDNQESDITNARKAEISTMQLPKGTDLFFDNLSIKPVWEKERTRVVYPTDSLAKTHGSLLGLFINRLYGNPLKKDVHSAFGGNEKDFGYCVFGPLFLGFALNVREHAKSNGVDQLWFLSRDGAIMKKAYDLVHHYIGGPKSEYVLTSRRALSIASIKSQADFLKVAQIPSKPSPLSHYLEHRYGIDPSIVTLEMLEGTIFTSIDHVVNPANHAHDLRKLLKRIYPLVEGQIQKEHMSALAYYKALQAAGSKVGLVDVGYAGTIQSYLEKILGEKMPGFYLMTHLKGRQMQQEGHILEGYLGQFIDHTSINSPYKDRISFIETVCSSDEPGLKRFDFDTDGTIKFEMQKQDTISSRRREVVRGIQQGILDFISDFMERFSNDLDKFDFAPELVTHWMFQYLRNPSYLDAYIFHNVEHEDLFGGHQKRYIVSNIKGKMTSVNNRLTADEERSLIETSDWKEGARAILPAKSGTKKEVPEIFRQVRIPVNIVQTINEFYVERQPELSPVLEIPNKIESKPVHEKPNDVASEQVSAIAVQTAGSKPDIARKLRKLIRNPKKFMVDTKICKLLK